MRRLSKRYMTLSSIIAILLCMPFLLMCANKSSALNQGNSNETSIQTSTSKDTGRQDMSSTTEMEPQVSSSVNSAGTTSTTLSESNTETTLSKKKITVNIASLKGPTSIGMIKMHDEKPSLGEDTASNYEIVATPDIMISKLISKEVDIATLPTNVAAKLYNKGLDFQLAAVIGENVIYVLSERNDIKSWEDLKGRTVSVVSKGSTPDVVIRYLLEKNNVHPNDVNLDYTIGQVELAQLMIAGRSEIATLPEPFATMVLQKNSNVNILFDFGKEWAAVNNGQALPMSCLVVNSVFAKNNPDIVNNFLAQYKESIQWVNSNINDAAILVEKFKIGMDAATAGLAIPRCNIKYTDSNQAKDIVNNYLNTLLDFSPEDIGGKIPDEKFYY